MKLISTIMTLYDEYSSQYGTQLLHFHQNHRKSCFSLIFEGVCRGQFQGRKKNYLTFFLFLSVIDQSNNKSALRLHKVQIQRISLCSSTVILLKVEFLSTVQYVCTVDLCMQYGPGITTFIANFITSKSQLPEILQT